MQQLAPNVEATSRRFSPGQAPSPGGAHLAPSFVRTGMSNTNLCIFDPQRQYRYLLTHRWDSELPLAVWIGLNPSTADEYTLDLTLKKIRGFTERQGLGGFAVVNLYAWRSTDPAQLATVSDPIGPRNDAVIQSTLQAKNIGMIIPCWGSTLPLPPAAGILSTAVRIGEVMAMLPRTHYCLGLTKNGQPRHPSRLAYDTPFVPFQKTSGARE